MLGYQTSRAGILHFVQPRPNQSSQLDGAQRHHNHRASPHNNVAELSKDAHKKRHAPDNNSISAEEVREELDWQFLETEYLEEYGTILTALEKRTQPIALHMDAQPEITWEMRPILLDFIIQAHLQLNLKPETLFLTINLMDRYLSKRVVYKKHYQLLGMCSLWVAAKYEDVKDNVPTCSDLWHMCLQCYDEVDFQHMERHVLNTLGYDLGFPTQEIWMKYLLATECMKKEGEEENRKVEFWENYDERKKVQDVARFAMEVAAFHRSFIWCPASTLSKSAIYLARYILGKNQIKPLLEPELLHCIQGLDQILPAASHTLQSKYSHKRLSRASQIVQEYLTSASSRPTPPWIAPDSIARGHNPRQLWIQPGLCSNWRQDRNLDDYRGQPTQYAQNQQQHHSHNCDPQNLQPNAPCRLPHCSNPPQPVCAPPTPVTPTMTVDETPAPYACALPEGNNYQYQQQPPPVHRTATAVKGIYANGFSGEHQNYNRGECDVIQNNHMHHVPSHQPGYAHKPNHLQVHIPHAAITIPHLHHGSQELPSPATSTASLPSPSLSSLSISSTSTACASSAAQYSAFCAKIPALDSNSGNPNSCLPPVLPTSSEPTPNSNGLRQVLTEYCVRWVDGGYPIMMVD